MATSKTILVDIDDTIINTCEAWCNWLNKKHGTQITPDDITNWDIKVFFPEISISELYAPLFEREFWTTVEPKEKAQQYIKALIREGFDVYLCSATHYKTAAYKFDEAVFKFFPFFHWDKTILCSKKQMVKADLLVDDAVHNLYGGDYQKILLSAPHNICFNAEQNSMIRANNWDEVYTAVHKLFDKKITPLIDYDE